jgi:hypothetical protein
VVVCVVDVVFWLAVFEGLKTRQVLKIYFYVFISEGLDDD